MTAHTPGPWGVTHPFRWKAEIRAHDRFIGHVSKAEGNMEEMEANARLVAAAPDLLHSLATLLAYIEAGQIIEKDAARFEPLKDSHAVRTAHAAIAKAEGRG